MASSKTLIARLARLDKKIALARVTEAADARNRARTLVRKFGFTADEVFGSEPSIEELGVAVAAGVKYRDPETGAHWAGHGRPPRWIANRDRSQFLV